MLSREGGEPADSGFVALSLTLPSLLAKACYALVGHPAQWTILHDRPALMEQGVEELLRYTGLSWYVRRRAMDNVEIGGASIRRGIGYLSVDRGKP